MTTFEIGTPVINMYGSEGFISAVLEPAAKMFVISTGMKEIRNEYEVCYFDGRISTLPDGIVAPFVERAGHMARVENVAERRAEIARLEAEKRAKDSAERDDYSARQKAFNAEAIERTPSWAKAVIVATLVEDKSDSMSDYFGSSTKRTVILGFSAHGRDLFPELRKFAATFAETAHLVDAPESAEHREKYSMGGGYFLKNGGRNHTGWQVQKQKFYGDAKNVPFGEWHIAEPVDVPAVAPAATAAIEGIRIEEHTHTKNGYQMFIAITPRVSREEFDRLCDLAKSLKGWYTRPWGKTPGGFAFKDRAKAEEFAGNLQPAELAETTTTPRATKPAAVSAGLSDKFRTMAEGLQKDIDNKFYDRQTNTPKRQREAATARQEGWTFKRAQEALRAMADHIDAGTMPAVLSSVKTKAQVLELSRSKIDRTNAGYYDAGVDTNTPAIDSEAARALWAMLGGKSEAEKKAEALKAKTDELLFKKIDGYFPTPSDLVSRMIDEADIPEGAFILEPSAGSGAIINGILASEPTAQIQAFEKHMSLREILALQGVDLIGHDFMEAEPVAKFDRVLMNPPFERLQDIEHVMQAHRYLKPDGRLVAIMSHAPFFRSDKKAIAFREWFDNLNGHKIDIAAGTFKESGTGVASVMVIIDA